MPQIEPPRSELAALAAALECPILADPLSGLRFGTPDRGRLLARYDAFLRHPEAAESLAPEWVLRFGAMPVSKQLSDFMRRHGHSRHILVAPHGDWPDPLHRSTEVFRTEPGALCTELIKLGLDAAPQSWLARWRSWERWAVPPGPVGDREGPPCEDIIIPELLSRLPAGAVLFSGNSLPIRQLDTWSGTAAKSLRILANRGASGIDGNLSTWLGLAAGGANPAVGLVGDLALFHDMNGLLLAQQLRAVLVVLNNGGGGIFGYLPQTRLSGYQTHWLSPTGLQPARIAELFGLSFHRVQRQGAFGPALDTALAGPGVTMIEVQIDRELSQRRHQAYWQALVGGGGPSARP
jgi:2-succinyl-5-enolpyruvyl-6-hydroxy-3-cyclohexene-1-carboxylate synthase